MSVVSMVGGATTSSGATFVCAVDGGGPVRVAVSTDISMSSPIFTSSQVVDAQGVAKVSITGLAAMTRYFWQTEDNSVIDTSVTGQLITAPTTNEVATFRIGFSGDAGLSPVVSGTGVTLAGDRLSNHPVFDTIRTRALAENWLDFIHLGDLHYYDLGSGLHGIAGGGTTANYRRSYSDVLLQPRQHALYNSVPWTYVWDDHDFGPNNSDGTLADKANALTAYGERVPHHLLGDTDGIYQSWERGRVLFVLSDLRYNRSPNGDTDNSSKTMLGANQKSWLEDVLSTSDAKFLVWVNPQQWLGTQLDSWASFTTERAELVEMFGDTGWLGRMCILSADYHGVALDTGGNSAGAIPVLQAAALDATQGAGSGGTYDLGVFNGRNQYGTLDVVDLGFALRLTLTGWRGADEELTSYTFAVLGDPPTSVSASGALIRTLRGSHRSLVEARVLTSFQTGDDPDGEEILIEGGDVTLDATADIERNAVLSTPGKNRWPRVGNDLLAPYGNEVFLRRGVDVGSEILWTSLGYFRFDTVQQTNAPDGLIRLTCFDRMKAIQEARLLIPRVYTPTTLVGVAVDDLVLDVYPEATILYDDDANLEELGREILVENDRYAALRDITNGLGKIMSWDDRGVLRIRTAPAIESTAWEITAGFKGVKVVANRHITREQVYNGFVVIGDTSGTSSTGGLAIPARGVAVDVNPLSPTYFFGRFGQVPKFYASPFIRNDFQAFATAAALLSRSIGLPYSVDFQAVPNPALRPFDTVRVRYADGTFELHRMERLVIPLDDVPMSGATREQTLVIVGAP